MAVDTSIYKELLRQMVRIPSPSFGEGECCSLLAGALEGFGLRPHREGNNIICTNLHYSPRKRTLALLAHIDTVPPCEGYTRDPYDPGTDEGTIHGLGSNDDGGSVVSMIAAFRHFFDMEMPVNLVLVLSCEEERSGQDGASLIFDRSNSPAFLPPGTSAAPGDMRLPYPDWAIIGEPTGMRAATSERGLLVLDGTANGKSGHAARNEGINAIYLALEDIEKLRQYDFVKISPEMGKVRLNVTQISAGTAHNVIPDSCKFVVDIRPTEMYCNEEILEELQKICTSTLVPRNLRNRSSATAPGSPLRQTAAGLGIECFSSPTTSDWMRVGCDAVKLGPGDSARSHKADEYILESEIDSAIELYIRFIGTFYGNIME